MAALGEAQDARAIPAHHQPMVAFDFMPIAGRTVAGLPLTVGWTARDHLFQFFHLCRQIGITANSVGGILARQNPDIVIRL
jgi:hypothetical protein